jgi:Glutamyl- and glutaminyl-tRNA synthetases
MPQIQPREELEFIKSIEEDVRWLGFDWSGQTKYASDNFHQFFEWGGVPN